MRDDTEQIQCEENNIKRKKKNVKINFQMNDV